MIYLLSKNPLVRKIVEEEAKQDLLMMLLDRQLPFTNEDYLESLVFVLKNEQYKSRALQNLHAIPDSDKEKYIGRKSMNHRVGYYILTEALKLNKINIVEKIVRNQAVPYDYLKKIAEAGTTSMLEVLIENQIKMIAYPEILDIIEKNQHINNFIKSKIEEIRNFYLRDEKPAEIPPDEVIEDIKEIISEGEADEELEELSEVEIEQKTMSTLQRINEMSVTERIKLALTGNKTERMILIKDPNKMVSMAVVESPKMNEEEVLLIVKNRSVAGDIITRISANREYTKNYPIMMELVHNPKTPVNYALGFIKKLHIRDLMQLARDKNVNPVVRKLAFNFYQEKSKVKK